jgi:hypothetical protein
LIYQGLLEEGLTIAKGVSERYDGVRRNPWNQIEWGNHYTRAMASYSLLLALSGFRYSAVEKTVTFQPRISGENFQCFFAAGSAWGLYSQRQKKGALTAKLECRHGEVLLKRLVLSSGVKSVQTATVTGPGGRNIPSSLKKLSNGLAVDLSSEIKISSGESLSVAVG